MNLDSDKYVSVLMWATLAIAVGFYAWALNVQAFDLGLGR